MDWKCGGLAHLLQARLFVSIFRCYEYKVLVTHRVGPITLRQADACCRFTVVICEAIKTCETLLSLYNLIFAIDAEQVHKCLHVKVMLMKQCFCRNL